MLPSYDVTLKTLYVAPSKGIKSLDGNGPMAFWISISNFDKNLQVFAPNWLDTLQEQTKCIYVKWHVYSAGPLLSSPFSGGLPPGRRQDFIVKYAIILIRQHDSDPASYVRNLQTSAWCYSWSGCKQKHHFSFLFCQLSNTFWPSGFGWKLYLFKGPPKPPALPFNLLGLQDDPERPRGGKKTGCEQPLISRKTEPCGALAIGTNNTLRIELVVSVVWRWREMYNYPEVEKVLTFCN